MKELYFDAEKHEYYEGETRIPSVTEIAGAVTGADFSKVNRAVLADAIDRGRAIHKDVELAEYKTPEGQWIAEKISGRQIAPEQMVKGKIGEVKYAGTLDLFMDDKELADIKSGVYSPLYTTIQLNLYRYAMGAEKIKKLTCFHVPSSGKYSEIAVQLMTDQQMQEVMDAWQDKRILPTDYLFDKEELSLDLVIKEKSIGKLVTNARQIQGMVEKKLADYKPENYSPENIAEAKKDKAELNKAAKTLSDERIKLKKEWDKPFEDFADIIKKTCDSITEASQKIDRIVKEVENREKEEIKEQIKNFFEDHNPHEWLDFEKVFNPRWLNKSVKMAEVESEILAINKKITSDLALLDRMNEPDAKAMYLETLNLDAALAEADRIKEARERMAAIEKAKAEKQEEQPSEPEIPAQEAPQEPQEEPEAEEPMLDMGEPVLERRMLVRGTREQIIALSRFMNEQDIYFEKLGE